MAKKKAKEEAPAPKAKARAKPRAEAPAAGTRVKWFDEKTNQPLLDTYARRLDSFIQTMADGVVDDSELKAQEERLVGLMQELEPLLDDHLHARVTRLLCEVTAYDIMQMLQTLQDVQPRMRFRG